MAAYLVQVKLMGGRHWVPRAGFSLGWGVLILAVVGLAVFFNWRRDRVARDHVAAWAKREGYTLRRLKRLWFKLGGPWAWAFTTSDNQIVFQIEVADPRGHLRTGWARCGSWWIGLLDDRVQVRWDEPEVAHAKTASAVWDRDLDG